MARRVFFSFHFQRDIFRVNQVRNSWLTKRDREAAGFFDASLWEKSKTHGDAAIKRLIDQGLLGTTVTVVLIGAETASRKYVQYEIEKSRERGNGMLGIYIHNLSNILSQTDSVGENPFKKQYAVVNGTRLSLADMYPTYWWYNDRGYENIGSWIERAAVKAGR